MSLLNINIGILGHVDSGKTALSKALSQIKSTAAFDKSTQSQERGITLDLGFSAMITDVPEHLNSNSFEKLQLTFVDCPGHASLIRTIIGGSQIIDFVILVIDVVKGIQTQTGECLVIAEITCPTRLIVALNKIDQVEASKREQVIEKMTKRIKNVLGTTKFKNSKIIPVSALKGEGLNEFIATLKTEIQVPNRDTSTPFLFAVDHCFAIKGQGTVCTGTVLAGKVKVNDQVEIPKLRSSRKVRSIQMFGKPVESSSQGDRIGMCLSQFNEPMERGILAAPGTVKTIFAAVIPLNRIKYFKNRVKSKGKFHMSVGYETVMAKIVLFYKSENSDEFIYLDELPEHTESLTEPYLESIFVLIEFEKAVLAPTNSLVIASKLDIDLHANTCRLAFYGRIDRFSEDKDYHTTFLPQLKIFKEKFKEGIIQRVVNDHEFIVTNLFKKQADRQIYIGLKVSLSTGELGTITSTFGQTNKLNVQFVSALSKETLAKVNSKEVKVCLRYKKYIYDKSNKMRQ